MTEAPDMTNTFPAAEDKQATIDDMQQGPYQPLGVL